MPAMMEHLIPAPAALVDRPQRSLPAVCLPGPGAHEVVPPCFATHVAGSVLSWLSRTLKNHDPPNPNKPDIGLYPWLDGGSVRESAITPLWYNYWPRPGRGRPITRLSILPRPPIGLLISTTAPFPSPSACNPLPIPRTINSCRAHPATVFTLDVITTS